jgi:hypothetical protein
MIDFKKSKIALEAWLRNQRLVRQYGYKHWNMPYPKPYYYMRTTLYFGGRNE